jgi:cystathionine gamma-synthase/methionine-gamma-lyase
MTGQPGNYFPTASAIHPATSFYYADMDDLDAVFAGTKPGYVYSRYGSPTVEAFEQAVTSLETTDIQQSGQAFAAQAFASGMAAIHGVLLAACAGSGSKILAAVDLYGATFFLVKNTLARLGIQARFIDAANLSRVEEELKHFQPALILVETISNPLLKVADLPALSKLARQAHALLVVDNTFATPWLVNPLQFGADYVIHSATKALSGHGDVLAGVTVTPLENKQKLFEVVKVTGGVLGPFEAWLALRGLKTLHLRMRQQCQTALQIAQWLGNHPQVAKVNYPGLINHPQYDLASQLFSGKGYGSVLSFEIAGADQSRVFRFMERLKLILPATTLGDIYSLVLHPASSSHRSLSPQERALAGIPDNLVRLSAGIEAIEDILSDLEQALES